MTYKELLSLVASYLQRPNDPQIVQLCGLTIGTTANKIQITQDINYKLFNQEKQYLATDNISVTSCIEQAINTFCYYLVSINLLGNIITTKGNNNTYSLPDTPEDNLPIGAFKVITNASATFIAGTTAFTDSGISSTFFSLDVSNIGTLINQAMRRIESQTNFRCMKVKKSFTLSANTDTIDNPIPNYKSIIGVYATNSSSRYPLTKKDLDYVEKYYPIAQTGIPNLIAEVPKLETSLTPDAIPNLQWMVRPVPDVDYTVVMTAYQYSPLLDGVIYSTNWWTQNAWYILLYASLVEAEPFLKNDDRIVTWKTNFIEAITLLINSERNEVFDGSLQYLTAENIY
jgi:hypothetical protein